MTQVSTNHIGRFMIAAGAVIEHATTGEVLVVRRNDEFHKDEWESIYGRIDQFEDLDQGLKREVFEETGIKDLKINKLGRIWRIFRGEKKAENEIYGFTFFCQTQTKEVQLSPEHSGYKWVQPSEAVEMLHVPGIKADMVHFVEHKLDNDLLITDPEEKVRMHF